MKYRKLTKDEWKDISVAVLKAREDAHKLTEVLGNKFPVKIALDKSLKILNKIESLRSELDTELGKQYKSNEMSRDEFFSYFYPGN